MTEMRKKFVMATALLTGLAVLLVLSLLFLPGRAEHAALQGAKLRPISHHEIEESLVCRGAYAISPDGRHTAWSRFERGGARTAVTELSTGRVREIPFASNEMIWARSSDYLLATLDHQGNENYHVYALPIDPALGRERNLTPYEGVRAFIVGTTFDEPGVVYLAHNKRKRELFDLYKVRIADGHEELIGLNPGQVTAWQVDPHGRYLGRLVRQESEVKLELSRTSSSGNWVPVRTWAGSDQFQVVGWGVGQNVLWALTNSGSDKIVLRQLDLDSGQETTTFAHPDVDLESEFAAPIVGLRSGQPISANTEYGYPDIKVFDERIGAMLGSFIKREKSRVLIESLDDAERLAIVSVFNGIYCERHLLDVDARRLSPLGRVQLSAKWERASPPKPISFTARDGTQLHGFLTLPSVDSRESRQRFPLVVRVHGGPWYRNLWGNSDFLPAQTQVHFLASRGYAVLEINYRGSTGYGKHFKELARGEFAGKMQEDLYDGIAWAISSDIADPKNIAVMGTSYGAYATLIAMAQEPDRVKCGIAASGPTDLAELIRSFPPYLKLHVDTWHHYVGDPSKPGVAQTLVLRSPIAMAEKIKGRLLLIHGKNDPRVSVEHSRQLVGKLEQMGGQVQYLEFPQDGHEIVTPGAKNKMYQSIERHLAGCLGGLDSAVSFW